MENEIVNDKEYLVIECKDCMEEDPLNINNINRFKIAKNKGAGWSAFSNALSEFLMHHSDCNKDSIIIRWM